MITNPILPGFNPDPSICRVGDYYYIATSTFEWFPGVQIHHSTDLANWSLVGRPLNRQAQLDMRGNPDSCGVWAPCLSFADDKFWLVYTDVKRLDGAFKDAHNYIVTCDQIDGEWSDPVYVNSSGFDPSLFHDDDGKKWFTNMQWNHRQHGTGCNAAQDRFDGILLQEWSTQDGLTGPVQNIYAGTSRGLTEAPHIFKRNGWYYLTTAEGGTGYEHAVSLARSRTINGPYVDHPNLHVLTTNEAPDHPLQRTGHGQYVEAANGEAWHTYLTGRPITDAKGNGRYCPMGRETGIAKCVWRDDWLYLAEGGMLPPRQVTHSANSATRQPVHHESFHALPPEFQWLRTPFPDRIFQIADGTLELIGRESIGSWFEQALVARRQEDASYDASTTVTFDPEVYQHAAGLTTYYNRHKFHAALITQEAGQRGLILMSCNGDWPEGDLDYPLTAPIAIPDGPITLSVEVRGNMQQFFWSSANLTKQPLGPPCAAHHISDEGGVGEHASFTGAFVGMVAFDLTGQAKRARFHNFSYSAVD